MFFYAAAKITPNLLTSICFVGKFEVMSQTLVSPWAIGSYKHLLSFLTIWDVVEFDSRNRFVVGVVEVRGILVELDVVDVWNTRETVGVLL